MEYNIFNYKVNFYFKNQLYIKIIFEIKRLYFFIIIVHPDVDKLMIEKLK